jgi:hypothetical protein
MPAIYGRVSNSSIRRFLTQGLSSSNIGPFDRSNGESNSAAYLLARLRRDRPDLAERLVRGEFKSVFALSRTTGLTGSRRGH